MRRPIAWLLLLFAVVTVAESNSIPVERQASPRVLLNATRAKGVNANSPSSITHATDMDRLRGNTKEGKPPVAPRSAKTPDTPPTTTQKVTTESSKPSSSSEQPTTPHIETSSNKHKDTILLACCGALVACIVLAVIFVSMGALTSIFALFSGHAKSGTADVENGEQEANAPKIHTLSATCTVEALRSGESSLSLPGIVIGGLEWYLNVTRDFETGALSSANSLSVHLLPDTSDTKWRATIDAIVTLSLSNGTRIEKKIVDTADRRKPFEFAMPWDEFETLTAKTGFIIVKVHFSVLVDGIRAGLEAYDHSLPHARFDTTLQIDDKPIYVCKAVLASYSRHFEELFYGGAAVKNKRAFSVQDVTYEGFLALLEHARTPATGTVTDDSVGSLLADASSFEFEEVVTQCELFLLSSNGKSNREKLLIADQYKLTKLESETIWTMEAGGAEYARDLMKWSEFELLSDRLKLLIYEQCISPDSSCDESWDGGEESTSEECSDESETADEEEGEEEWGTEEEEQSQSTEEF